MTRYLRASLGVALNVSALSLCAVSAFASPDLRQGRPAGPLTVYPDDARRNVFYYPPGDLAIATGANGAPDIHLLHARYTGSAVNRDRGTNVLRSIFTVRLVMSGPTAAELGEARKALAAGGAPVELRPLPIRRLESAIVYAPISNADATDSHDRSSSAAEASDPNNAAALPKGHFEAPESSAPREGFWTERVYTLGLAPGDAQLLSSAFERGQVALSIGYAFLADGVGPEQPLEELSGSPALVEQLKKAIGPPAPAAADDSDTRREQPRPHLVRAGAVAITADLKAWPQIVRRVDINESVPPGYAALDVYCYDFNQTESALYEKQVEIEAAGVGGRPVTITASFSRSQPDTYAHSVRFPVAVRLDRPYRFRIVEVAQDGTSKTTSWRERASWTDLLDVTSQGDDR